MDNKEIASHLKLLGKLMELHDENSFKVRAIQGAVFRIDKYPEALSDLTLEQLEKHEGIGKGLAQKINELNTKGELEELNYYLSITPSGILDILKIKGLGPKKVQTIWNDLGIESLVDLEYACNENRLIELKGFGAKTQTEVLKNIAFLNESSGKLLYSKALEISHSLEKTLNSKNIKFEFTGAFRRQEQIIEQIDVLVNVEDFLNVIENIQAELTAEIINSKENNAILKINNLKFKIQNSKFEHFFKDLFKWTGNELHLQNFDLTTIENKSFNSEEEIYAHYSLPYILPELREGLGEIEKAKDKSIPELIKWADLKGTLHNHSTYSDGVHSLEKMATYAKEIGLEYLGICDHSQTAVYAKGLKPERVLEQHEEIEKLNSKLAPFKIFKGIESDILSDGSLDYTEEILKSFDFVVASIHQGFKMDEERATGRLIKAIENPFTSVLGHPTGRLLLGREGYPINHKKIIDACAANNVVIEINANPLRLDLDWRWHRYALEKGVLLSINPDAHRKEGFHDMHYGVLIGRKGGLTAKQCLNSFTLQDISQYFNNKK